MFSFTILGAAMFLSILFYSSIVRKLEQTKCAMRIHKQSANIFFKNSVAKFSRGKKLKQGAQW